LERGLPRAKINLFCVGESVGVSFVRYFAFVELYFKTYVSAGSFLIGSSPHIAFRRYVENFHQPFHKIQIPEKDENESFVLDLHEDYDLQISYSELCHIFGRFACNLSFCSKINE